MPTPTPSKWWQAPLVFLVATLVCCLYFQDLLLDPNRAAPTFGGDGLTIHYNLQWHATYGEGAYLNNQYLPYRESIFMTDAHALIATVLAALRPVFPEVGKYAVGISNLLVFGSNPLAILLLFLCLRKLKVRWGLALAGGVLIGLMAPQILRQMGQYTLGFTLLLPATLWYLLSYTDQKWYWLKGLFVTVLIYLVGLNNPYLYAIAVSFILAAFGVGLVLRLLKKDVVPWARLWQWLGVVVLTTAAVFLTLKAFDHVEDRVEVPFGFFHNTAVWGGMLSSKMTFDYEFIRGLLPGMAEPRRENRLYLGLIPILSGVLLPLLLLVPRWRQASGLPQVVPLLLLIAASLLGLVFAFGLPFNLFEYWTYEHLGSILQFRAPVRFAWPLYYVLGVTAVFLIDQFYGAYSKHKWMPFLVVLPLLIWGVQAHQYLSKSIISGPNAFWEPNLQAFRDIAAEQGINANNYSSIFLLPTEHGWTDKLHHEGAWKSNHDGYKMSLATGLPLLNGKLSRVSLAAATGSLQLLSHPLIEKPLLDKIPGDKDILLLNSVLDSLEEPEKRIRALGERIFQNGKIELRRLSPDRLLNQHRTSVRAAKTDSSFTEDFLRIALESDERHAFVGQGSRYVERGWTQLFQVPADTLAGGVSYELSFWNYVDKSRFGGPKCYFRLLGANGKRLKEYYIWTNEVFDFQAGWLRVSIPFDIPPGTTRLELVTEYNFPYWIDEILLRPLKKDVAYDGLYNNYRLVD